MIFDIAKLRETEEYDVIYALGNFIHKQEYFDELTDFVKSSRGYLSTFNPTLIIYSEDIRNDFLAELEKVKRIFRRLGIRLNGAELENIEGAIKSGSEKELSDGLVKFSAKMQIMAERLSDAQEQKVSAKNSTGSRKASVGGNKAGANGQAETLDEKPVIIAVDDMPEILSTVTGILESKYKVIAVTSGRVALKAIETHNPVMFIFDIDLPDINGLELAAEIRRNHRFAHIPILFLTGRSSRDSVLTAMALGASEYILKPISRDLLIAKIDKCLGKK